MMCKVLFLNTIWADVLLMLGLLLLLNTISGALQLNSGPVFADPSLRDELALAEARRSIMAVITDGEMVLKDDKIMQAGQRTCHYLEGLLGKNEVGECLTGTGFKSSGLAEGPVNFRLCAVLVGCMKLPGANGRPSAAGQGSPFSEAVGSCRILPRSHVLCRGFMIFHFMMLRDVALPGSSSSHGGTSCSLVPCCEIRKFFLLDTLWASYVRGKDLVRVH